MVYVKFTPDTPVITDTGAEVIDDTRQNLMALRDAVVAGTMVDWNMSTSGPAAEPTEILYSKGTERVRLTITWASSNPSTVIYAYSANSGGVYDTIGTWTGTYDGSGNLTDEVWS